VGLGRLLRSPGTLSNGVRWEMRYQNRMNRRKVAQMEIPQMGLEGRETVFDNSQVKCGGLCPIVGDYSKLLGTARLCSGRTGGNKQQPRPIEAPGLPSS
jgi:hypothetical protein